VTLPLSLAVAGPASARQACRYGTPILAQSRVRIGTAKQPRSSCLPKGMNRLVYRPAPGQPARCRVARRLPEKGFGQAGARIPVGRVRREKEIEGQFIQGAYTNPAGTRAYKLYIRAGIMGKPCPWSSCCMGAPKPGRFRCRHAN